MNANKIKILWCDDEYQNKILDVARYMYYLEDNNVEVEFLRNSDELFVELEKPFALKHVDAVVFDYNMSNSNIMPNGIVEKSGFLDIIRNMDKYVKAGIPFYLWSKMTQETIEENLRNNPDLNKELNRFRSYILDSRRPRFYPGYDTFEETVDAVIAEVNDLATPKYKLKNEYPDAYEMANMVSDTCWAKLVRLLTLTSPDSSDWQHMEDLVNPIRSAIDDVMKKLDLPIYDYNSNRNGIKLAELGHLVSNSHKTYKLANDSLKDENLGYCINILLKFVQDASHNTDGLEFHVRKYLVNSKDYHLLQFIAHGFISILEWAKKAMDYIEDTGSLCVER